MNGKNEAGCSKNIFIIRFAHNSLFFGMSKESILIFLGIFVAIMPFLGFPEGLRTAFFVTSGLVMSFLALLIYARERLLGEKKTRRRAPAARTAKKSSANAVPEITESSQGELQE